DGGGGSASHRDRECPGIVACEPGGVHAVECAGGSAALAGRGPEPVRTSVAGLAGVHADGGARYGITTDLGEAPVDGFSPSPSSPPVRPCALPAYMAATMDTYLPSPA